MNKLWICILALLALALPAAAGVGVWTPLGPDGGPVLALAVDPADPDVVYAGTTHGIFKSTDGGETWTKVSRNLLGGTYYDLVVDPRAPSILHVGTASGLWRSDERGGSWKRVPALGNRPVPALVYQGDRLLAGSTQSVFWSDDQGRTWTRARRKPEDPVILDLAAGPDKVYAGTAGDGSPHGVYRSLDRGDTWAAAYRGLDSQLVCETWTPARRGLAPIPLYDLTVDPTDPHRLYAGTATRSVFTYTEP